MVDGRKRQSRPIEDPSLRSALRSLRVLDSPLPHLRFEPRNRVYEQTLPISLPIPEARWPPASIPKIDKPACGFRGEPVPGPIGHPGTYLPPPPRPLSGGDQSSRTFSPCGSGYFPWKSPTKEHAWLLGNFHTPPRPLILLDKS